MPFFFWPDFLIFFPILDVSMFFSIVLDATPHLRYWNLSLKPKTSSNAYFDRLPCKFSRFWAPLQGNRTFSRQVQFYCSGAQNFENLHGSLSQPIFDRNVERSSKFQYRRWGLCCQISKITQSRWNKIRLKNGQSWCLANEHLFFLRPPLLCFLKTVTGACRSRFFIENPSQARNFSM